MECYHTAQWVSQSRPAGDVRTRSANQKGPDPRLPSTYGKILFTKCGVGKAGALVGRCSWLKHSPGKQGTCDAGQPPSERLSTSKFVFLEGALRASMERLLGHPTGNSTISPSEKASKKQPCSSTSVGKRKPWRLLTITEKGK